ncbi:MAG: c-type cytochrome [Phenylobacterium sp.]
MNFFWRMVAWICGTAVFLACLSWITVNATSSYILREKHPVAPETVRAAVGPAAIANGRRLGRLYGCQSCHGEDLRGHAYNSDPTRVRNYAPNLTRIAPRYTDAELAQAIRQGVRPTTRQALWDMPSASFATMHDADLAQILAFVRAAPAGGAGEPSDTPGLRGRLAILRGRTGDLVRGERSAPALVAAARAQPAADLGFQYAQGRYIAATVCSECHGSDLRGDRREGGSDLAVIRAYDLAQFQRLLRTGASVDGRPLGEMSEIARKDLHAFTDPEIAALYAYLRARAATER